MLLPVQLLADSVVVDAADQYMKNGVLGLSVVVLAVVVAVLWVENRRKDKEYLLGLEGQHKTHLTALEALYKTNEAAREALHKGHLEALEKIQSQRVLDAQAVTAQMLKLTESCTTALTNVSTALNAQREMNSDVKDTIGDVIDEMRAHRMSR